MALVNKKLGGICIMKGVTAKKVVVKSFGRAVSVQNFTQNLWVAYHAIHKLSNSIKIKVSLL